MKKHPGSALVIHPLYLYIAMLLTVLTFTLPVNGQAKDSAINNAISSGFGTAVEAVSAFEPFYVTGDFDGDGKQDIAVVVRIKGARSTLPKDVQLSNPFERAAKIRFPAASENKLALAVIHNWKTTQPVRKYLLIGESPVLILEDGRASSTQLDDRKNLIEVMTKRKRRKDVTVPVSAKGDVILMGTEVGGDSVLYWNGRTYMWNDAAED